ncbi:MAG: hypothetical protein ACYDDF_08330 [Thermoplasmatota archaeon]
MADRDWLVFVLIFFVLPAIAIAVDLLWLSKFLWTIPWLTLLALVWVGIGMVMGIGFLSDDDSRPADRSR